MANPVSSRVSLARALGEFAVIVLGVLVALAVDSWVQEQRDRVAERDALLRLIEDVRQDTASFAFQLQSLREKSEALLIVESAVRQGLVRGDTLRFQRALQASTAFGWGMLPLRSVTIDELTATGGLDLISDPSVLRAVLNYRANATHRRTRVERRATGYPDLIYRAAPPELLDLARTVESARVPMIEPRLASRAVAALRGNAVLLEELVAEQNYAFFAAEMVADNLDEATALIATLEAEVNQE